jgi:phage baseplate assembly protein W
MMALIINVALASKDRTKKYVWKDAGFKSLKMVVSNGSSQIDNSKYDLAAVANSLSNLFTFKKGERILLPEFGNSIYDLVGLAITDAVVNLTETGIRGMLEWEPRINVGNVTVSTDPDNNEILASINYSVPSVDKSGIYQASIPMSENGVIQ